MEIATIGAEVREAQGKGPVKRLRKEGFVPGIVYGDKKDNVNVSIPAGELRKVDLGSGQIFKVQVAGEGEHMVLIREVQKHPVSQQVIHLDLFEVSMTEKLTTTCMLSVIGEPAGVADGGILQFGLREVDIECLPTDIPESIVADVSQLELGGAFKVEDLEAPEGVVILTDPEQLVATLVTAQYEEEETEEVGDEEVLEAAPETEEEEEASEE